MLKPEEILTPDAAEMEWLNRQHHTSSLLATRTNDLIQIIRQQRRPGLSS
jgi:hypothetical protein